MKVTLDELCRVYIKFQHLHSVRELDFEQVVFDVRKVGPLLGTVLPAPPDEEGQPLVGAHGDLRPHLFVDELRAYLSRVKPVEGDKTGFKLPEDHSVAVDIDRWALVEVSLGVGPDLGC